MLPFPSAVKEPTRAKNVGPLLVRMVPLMKKAYWPFRLELEKLPVGGGGVGFESPPPQAAAQIAQQKVRRSANCFKKGFAKRVKVAVFIAPPPADWPKHFWRRPCRAPRRDPTAIRDLTGPPRPAIQPAPAAREKPCSCRRFETALQSGRSCPA